MQRGRRRHVYRTAKVQSNHMCYQKLLSMKMTSSQLAHCSLNSTMPVQLLCNKYDPLINSDNYSCTYQGRKCHVKIMRLPPKLDLRLQQQRGIKMHHIIKYFRTVLESRVPETQRLSTAMLKVSRKKKRELGCSSTSKASQGKPPNRRTHRTILQELLNVDANGPTQAVTKGEDKDHEDGCQSKSTSRLLTDLSSNIAGKEEALSSNSSVADHVLSVGNTQTVLIQSNNIPYDSCHATNVCPYFDTSPIQSFKATDSLPNDKPFLTSARKFIKDHTVKKSYNTKDTTPSTPQLSSSKKAQSVTKVKFSRKNCSTNETTNCTLVKESNARDLDTLHHTSSSHLATTDLQQPITSSTTECVSKYKIVSNNDRNAMEIVKNKDFQQVSEDKTTPSGDISKLKDYNDSKTCLLDDSKIIQRGWLERLKLISKAVQSEKTPCEKKPSGEKTDTTTELQNKCAECNSHAFRRFVSLDNSSKDYVLPQDIQEKNVVLAEKPGKVTLNEQKLFPGQSGRTMQPKRHSNHDTQHYNYSERGSCAHKAETTVQEPAISYELKHQPNTCTSENAQTLCDISSVSNHDNRETNSTIAGRYKHTSKQVTKMPSAFSPCPRSGTTVFSSNSAYNSINCNKTLQAHSHSQMIKTQIKSKEITTPRDKKFEVDFKHNEKTQKDNTDIQDTVIQNPLYDDSIGVSSLGSTFERSVVDISTVPENYECTMYAPTSQTAECDVAITPPIDTKDILSRVMTAVFFSDEDEPEDVILSRTAVDSAFKTLNRNVDFDHSGMQPPALLQLQPENALSPLDASKIFYNGYCIGDGDISNIVQNLLDDLLTSVCHTCDSSSDSIHRREMSFMTQASYFSQAVDFEVNGSSANGDNRFTASANHCNSVLSPEAAGMADFRSQVVACVSDESCERQGKGGNNLENDADADFCDDTCSNNTDFVSLKLSSGYDTEDGETPRPPSRTSSMFHSDVLSDDEEEDRCQHQPEMFSPRSGSPLSDIECTVRKVTEDILSWIENGRKIVGYQSEIPVGEFDIQQSFVEAERTDSTLPMKLAVHLEGNDYTAVYASDEENAGGEEDEGFMQMPLIESVYSIRDEVAKDFFVKSPCDEDMESKSISYDIASPDDDNSNWNEQEIYCDEGIKRTLDNSEIYYSSYTDSDVYLASQNNGSDITSDTRLDKSNQGFHRSRTVTSSVEGGGNVLDTWAAEMETEQHISKTVTHVMYSILKKCEDIVDACSSEKHIPAQVVTKYVSRVEKVKHLPSLDTERNKISLKLSLKRIQEMSNTKHVRKITRRMHRLSLEEEEEEQNNLASREISCSVEDAAEAKLRASPLDKEYAITEDGSLVPHIPYEADGSSSTARDENKPKLLESPYKLSPAGSPRRTPSPFYLCYARIDSNHVIKSVNCEENDGNDQETKPLNKNEKTISPAFVCKEKDGLSKYIMSRIQDGKNVNDWKIASVKTPDLAPININLLDKMADDVGKEFFFDQDETKSFKESAKIILTAPGKPQSNKKRRKRQKKTYSETKKVRTRKETSDDANTRVTMAEKRENGSDESIHKSGVEMEENEGCANTVQRLGDSKCMHEEMNLVGPGYYTDEDILAMSPVTTDANSDEDGDYSPGVCTVAMQSELVARFLRHKRKNHRNSHSVPEHDLDGMLTRMRSLRNRGGNDVVAVDFDNPIPLEYKQTRRKRPATSASEESFTEVQPKQKSSDVKNPPKKRKKYFTKTKMKDGFRRAQNQYKKEAAARSLRQYKMDRQKISSEPSTDNIRRRKFFRSRDAYEQPRLLQHKEEALKSLGLRPCLDKQATQEATAVNPRLYDFDDDEDVKSLPSDPKPKDIQQTTKADESPEGGKMENELLPSGALPQEGKEFQDSATSSTETTRFLSPPRSPSPKVLPVKKQTVEYDEDLIDSADEGEGRLLIVVDTDEEETREDAVKSSEKTDTEANAPKKVPEKVPTPELSARVTSVITSVSRNYVPESACANTPVVGSNTTTVSSAPVTPITSVVFPIVSTASIPSAIEANTSVSAANHPNGVCSTSTLVSAPSLVTSFTEIPHQTTAASLPVTLPTQPLSTQSTIELANQIAAACLRASSVAAAANKTIVIPPPAALVRSSVAVSAPSTVISTAVPGNWPPMQARHSLASSQVPPSVSDANKDCTTQYERLKNELMMLEMVALQKERERNNILRLKQYKQNIMRKLQLKKSMMQAGTLSPDGAAIPQQQSSMPVVEGRSIQNLFKTMVLQQAALQAASTASAMRQQALYSTAVSGSNPQQVQPHFRNPPMMTAPVGTATSVGNMTVPTSLAASVNAVGSQRLPTTNVVTHDLTKAPLFVPSQVPLTKIADPAAAALMLADWKKPLKLLTNSTEVNSSLSSVDAIVAKANENFGMQLQDWLKEATRIYIEQQAHLANLQQPQMTAGTPTTGTATLTSLPCQPGTTSHPVGLPNPAAAGASDKRQHMSLDDVIRNVYSRRINLPKPTAVPAQTTNLGYVPIPVIRGPHQPGVLPSVYPSMTVTSLSSPTIVTAPIVRPTVNLPYSAIPNEQIRPGANCVNAPAFRPVNKDLTNVLGNKIYNAPTTSTLAQLLMTPPQDRPDKKDSEDRNNEVTIVGEQPANTLAIPGSKSGTAQAYTVTVNQDSVPETSDESRNRANRNCERKLFPKWPQCQGCRAKLARFICAGCNNQWYCSEPCQVKHWKIHFRTCRSRR